MTPKYSIVIPTFNNYQYLGSCLESIFKSCDPALMEIVVVDNGSSDNTQAFLTQVSGAYPFVKFIRNEENLGFCKATNQGMGVSSGKYIVWLNDDTIVSKGWLQKLEQAITDPHPYHDNIAMSGPLSNNAAGKQGPGNLHNMGPQHLQEVNKQAEESIAQQLADVQKEVPTATLTRDLAGFLSGFCLMLKREVYQKIGGIDERFSPGGFCDNDFVLRAYNSGFAGVVDPKTIVFHYGSKTLDRYYPGLARGVANWPKFVSKYNNPKQNKLLLIQRVKIDDLTQLNVFTKCAKLNAPLVDGVIILSDRSENLTYEDCKRLFGDKLIEFVQNSKHTDFDERRDRLLLQTKAYKSDYDWCLSLDHDECLSANTTRERLDQLMNPLNPGILAYEMHKLNYWRSNTFIRIDGLWGSTFAKSLWKNVVPPSLRPVQFKGDVGLHCGTSPNSIPPEMVKACDITMDHYGYADEQEAQRKYDFYNKVDCSPDAIKQHLVSENCSYDHLKNEGPITVVRPQPFSISLNMMLKNEAVNVGLTLLDYSSVITDYAIIDTGSTDNTVANLKEVGIPVTEIPFNNDFSEIRNKCIELSTSKYCMHIDPDERPEEGYLQRLIVMLVRDPDVCLWHLKTAQKGGYAAATKQPRVFRRRPDIFYSGRVHEVLDSSLEKIKGLKFEDIDLTSINTGFLDSDEAIYNKLAFYGNLLEMEIKDNPDNAKARYELSLHYRNLDRIADAQEQLKLAIQTNPGYVVAIRELALIKISEAYEILKTCENKAADPLVISSLKEIERVLRPIHNSHVKVGKPVV